MQAIILAAGFGNRMRPLTDNLHKTLIEVNKKTLLARTVDLLIQHRINRLVVVTGYRDEEIINYLDTNYPLIEKQYINNPDYEKTNNIYSLFLAASNIKYDKDIILIECDLVFEPKVLDRLISSPHKNVALVDKWKSGLDGTVVTVSEGLITGIIPPHLQDARFDITSTYKTLNMYKFELEFFQHTFKPLLDVYGQLIDQNCYYELVLGMLVYMRKAEINAEILNGEKWCEIDDANDLNIARFEFTTDQKEQILSYAQGGYWNYDVKDFCFIRNMYFPNQSILNQTETALPSLMHNYGSKQKIINEKCAFFLGTNSNFTVALNGASQIYPMLKDALYNRQFAIPTPTFGEYYSTFPDQILYDDSSIPWDTKAEGLVVVNPNNPTGRSYKTEKLYEWAQKNIQKLLIVDESFIEFSDQKSIVSIIESEENPAENIIVIKSLSKTLGVPGVRMGYVYTANQEYINDIMGKVPIWNSNSIAEFMYETMIKHRDDLAKSYELTKSDRDNFIKRLRKISKIKTWDSQANYIIIETSDKYDLVNKVLNQGIFIKDVSSKFIDKSTSKYRIAVRSIEDNEELARHIEKIMIDYNKK